MMIAASLYAPKIAAAFAAVHVLVYLAIISPRPVGADVPVQKYYLPLSEDHLLDSMTLVNTASNSPVTSLTAITVSSLNTIIYVDHWEDGYEANILSPTSADSEIWGDNNAANGCSPAAIEAAAPNPCSDADDVLTPGTAIVIQNDVPVNPRDPTYRSGGKFVTDGGDIIASTFPIAITRGGYPTGPGSLLGGAVEVANTDSWGTTFIWPGATDLVTLETDTGNAAMDSFQLTDVFIMAREDGTEVLTPAGIDAVTRPDGVSDTSGFAASYILNAGESVRFEGIKLADRKVTADKPVQAALITGDKDSSYEMRWYSLVPVEQWSDSYYTPVGSTDTRVYFTAETAMTINYDNINGTNQGSFDIPAGGIAQFDLANGSGFKFHSQNAGDKFFGITQTDISGGGSASDWGHPMIPGDIMTSQVLLGLAYACTDNICESDKYYSPVWLTAVDNAIIYIDYNSDGVEDDTVSVTALQSIHIEDTNDKDMTGATIWATKTDGSGDGVDIAVAWGQDPDYPTDSVQAKMLDMGTVVLPLPILESLKTCVVAIDNDNDGVLSPGDTLNCTIRITNTGQADISNLQVCSDLANYTTYIRDSTSYESSGDAPISISDDPTSEPYPLGDCHLFDGGFVLQARSALEISYQMKLDPCHQIPDGYDAVVATGYITGSSDSYAEFDSRDAISKSSFCCPIQTGEMGTQSIFLGDLTRYLFFFEDGTSKGKIAGDSKGFLGDIVSNIPTAKEETGGTVVYSGELYTGNVALGAFQDIITSNADQASAVAGQTTLVNALASDFDNAVAQIDGLTATETKLSITTSSLLTDLHDNTSFQNGIAETYVIDVTDAGCTIDRDHINIYGDASDVFVFRWDKANGYACDAEFKNGAAIVPQGGLTPGNFFHLAGSLKTGGSDLPPLEPYPQGPYVDGSLISGGSDFDDNYFTGYWLTIETATTTNQGKLSNAVWVGGWYTNTTHVELDKGGAVYTCPNFLAVITESPTSYPSSQPSSSPSELPSSAPSGEPSKQPSDLPSSMPSLEPSKSSEPSSAPSDAPIVSMAPSTAPSDGPSVSSIPSSAPSDGPSIVPSSSSPTDAPFPVSPIEPYDTSMGGCKTFNITNQLQNASLELDQFAAFFDTTECMQVTVHSYEPSSDAWNLVCLGNFRGLGSLNKTAIPVSMCSRSTLLPGEDRLFRLEYTVCNENCTVPCSCTDVVAEDLPSLRSYYEYSDSMCATDTSCPA